MQTVETAAKLLREWSDWFDAGEPKYKAPSGMTRRFLTDHEREAEKRKPKEKS